MEPETIGSSQLDHDPASPPGSIHDGPGDSSQDALTEAKNPFMQITRNKDQQSKMLRKTATLSSLALSVWVASSTYRNRFLILTKFNRSSARGSLMLMLLEIVMLLAL